MSRSSPDPHPPSTIASAKINMTVLPTRTTLLFLLIALIIYLPIFSTLTGHAPVCGPFVVFAMIVLPLYDFLSGPDREIRRHHLQKTDHRYPHLVAEIERLSEELAISPCPRVLLKPNGSGGGPYAFGTWRRRFLAIPDDMAEMLDRDLEDLNTKSQAQALLVHEMQHFAQGDVLYSLYTRSLLRTTAGFLLFNLTILLMMPFLYLAFVQFFNFLQLWPPDLITILQQVDPEMSRLITNPPPISPITWLGYEAYAIAAHVPLILGSAIMLVVLWPALLRTRELYADVFTAATQRWGQYLDTVLIRQSVRTVVHPPAISTGSWRPIPLPFGLGLISRRYRALARWRDPHPTLQTRRSCLRSPDLLYGGDLSIAITAGGTVVLLNLALSSLWLSRYTRSPNATIPFVLGFVIISVSLIPYLCQFHGTMKSLRHKVIRIVLCFTAIKLVPQFLTALVISFAALTSPNTIIQSAYALVGPIHPDMPAFDIPWALFFWNFVFGPALLFSLIMPLTLVMLLLIDIRLKRIMLTWYGLPLLKKHPVALLWGSTGVLAMILWFVIVPFFDKMAAPSAHSLLNLWILFRMVFALIVLSGVAVIFLLWNRRYANICPGCHSHLADGYRFAMSCPACGHVLHAWLIASY